MNEGELGVKSIKELSLTASLASVHSVQKLVIDIIPFVVQDAVTDAIGK